MVYTYKRKTDRASWSDENLAKAVEEAKKTSKLNASKMYGIPYATLHRHIASGSTKKNWADLKQYLHRRRKKSSCSMFKRWILYSMVSHEPSFCKLLANLLKGKENLEFFQEI